MLSSDLRRKLKDRKRAREGKQQTVKYIKIFLFRHIGHGWQASKALGAIFYAHGPSFKRGYKTKQPLQAIDVYPLLCHLLDIKPLPNNGSMENIKEVLHSSSLMVSDIRSITTITALVAQLLLLFTI
jgi:hypothetical protein